MNRGRRNFATGVAATALFLAILFLHRTSAFQRADSPPRQTLLITMGERATSGERWDGSAEVSSGTIVGVEGWHFVANQSITGSS